MGLWPYYSNALLYGDYANEANLHTRTKVHGIVTVCTHTGTSSIQWVNKTEALCFLYADMPI